MKSPTPQSPIPPARQPSPSRGASRFARTALAAWCVLVLLAGGVRAELSDQECLKCHGETWIANMRPEALAAMVRLPPNQPPVLRNPNAINQLFIAPAAFKQSAHAGLSCTACHRGIDKLPHDQRLAKLSCADCHAEVEKTIAGGAHRPDGMGGKATPSCADCHGAAHDIAPLSAVRTYRQAERIVTACSRCHDENHGGTNPVATYRDNVHGQALFAKGLAMSAICTDCHGTHAMLPPSDAQSPVGPLQAPKTCGRCHQGIAEVYYTSIHGQNLLKGKAGAATCTSCHKSHGIGPINQAFMVGVAKECSHCHQKLSETYLKSYHGKATSLGGSGSAAVCSSCHGAHDILPPSDPRSHVAPANLVKTCSQCHTHVNKNFVKYLPHVDYMDPRSSLPVFIVWLGMTCLLCSVLAVFIPHGLLWFQRTLIERIRNPQGYHLRPAHERRIVRFHPIHRFTHALIIISFMGLVATGFPLKYSYANWAKTIADLLGGSHMMGLIHRALAVVTFSYAAMHAGFLGYFFIYKCPKPRRKYLFGPDSLIFSWRDLKDFIAMVRWFFWLGPRPQFDRWIYFEKFDYWGEVWGVFLIGGTGLMLWLPTLFTRWLPGWVLNCAMVIHSIEALLAASVIFLVHFFNTHLRPEKFPIDMVMLTGQMSESEMKEERPAEYERMLADGTLESRLVEPVALKWRVLGAILGMITFFIGIGLIVLALKTEISQFFH